MHSIGTWGLWTGFFAFVAVVFCIDMFWLGGGKSHRVSTREACRWTFIWVLCALLFNAILWWSLSITHGAVIAHQKSLEFLTGYIIEESLSVDNMFVILMIFHFFAVPAEYQRRVLLYGVLGAIVMRFLMILMGTWLVSELHWILYVFGAFLFFTGIKMLLLSEKKAELSENSLVIWLNKHLRVTRDFHEEKFFIRQNAMTYVTPLFLALVLVEVSDLIFAFDSIPAIFSVTQDPFIVFTSNIFAILGLRSLYFLLANLASRFYLLKYGIAILLSFVGTKMLIAPWVEIPIVLMLGIVAAILLTTVLLSLVPRRNRP